MGSRSGGTVTVHPPAMAADGMGTHGSYTVRSIVSPSNAMRASVCEGLVGTTWNSMGPSWYGKRAPSRGYATVGAAPAGVPSRSPCAMPWPTTLPFSDTVTVAGALVTVPETATTAYAPGASDAKAPPEACASPNGETLHETDEVTSAVCPSPKVPCAVSCAVTPGAATGYLSESDDVAGVTVMLVSPWMGGGAVESSPGAPPSSPAGNELGGVPPHAPAPAARARTSERAAAPMKRRVVPAPPECALVRVAIMSCPRCCRMPDAGWPIRNFLAGTAPSQTDSWSKPFRYQARFVFSHSSFRDSVEIGEPGRAKYVEPREEVGRCDDSISERRWVCAPPSWPAAPARPAA